MLFDLLSQTVVNGINIGALYGLIAIGLSLTFGVMKFLNVGHGEFVVIGGYVSYWLLEGLNIDPFLSIPLVLIALFIIGAICYKLFFSALSSFHEEEKVKNSLLIGFGLYLVLPQLMRFLWTGDERAITPSYSGNSFAFLNIRCGYIPLAGVVIAIAVTIALHYFLHKTYFGKAVRATTENWKAAKLMGINVNRTYMITFSLGIAIAGLGGVMAGLTQSISPDIGMEWTLKALIVLVLAGVGKVRGTFIAGLILGIIEAVGAIFMGPYSVTLSLVVFLSILMYRPQGLFGNG